MNAVNLVCPRDRLPLVRSKDSLTCSAGHSYPIHGEIPVFILGEAEQTHPSAERALRVEEILRDLARDDGQTPPLHELHPYVRSVLIGTCGSLYAPIAQSIDRYPIPELPSLPPRAGATFLDIGCNWGRWSIAAAQLGYSVTAVDTNLAALVVARRVFRQFGLAGTFICADARHLPFAAASFDLAFSYSVFMYFTKENARAAIAEAARVSTDRVLIQMANKFGLLSLYHRARRDGSMADPLRVRYWNPRELLSVFNELAGPSTLIVDGVVGRGLSASERAGLLPHHRLAVAASAWLKALRLLAPIADSLFVQSDVARR
jgi:SAM-dependent methyltransferase